MSVLVMKLLELTIEIDDFPNRTTIYRGFSMAMLNNQRVLQLAVLDLWQHLFNLLIFIVTSRDSIDFIFGIPIIFFCEKRKHRFSQTCPFPIGWLINRRV